MTEGPSAPQPESQPRTTTKLPKSAAAATETIKTASRNALTAFKVFATNPTGGLEPAYTALGDAKALNVGITFGLVSVICFLVGGYLLLPSFIRQDLFEMLGFSGVLKCLLFAVMPFVCSAASSLGLRKILHGQGGFGADCFIPGAALLPMSVWVVISGILGYTNYQAIFVLTIFAGCTGILMLFFGYTRITRLSDRNATIGVPVVILITVVVTKMFAGSIVSGAMPGGMQGFPYSALSSMSMGSSSPGKAETLSGTYVASAPDGSKISLAFKKNGTTHCTITGSGDNQSVDGTYQMNGNSIYVSVPGEMPMVLVRNGNVLEQNMGGISLRFTKK